MSAPSKPVQIIPPGLLGMLQLKNMGRLPDTLMGEYQPTIDMREWLMVANREYLQAVANIPIGSDLSTTFWAFNNPGPIIIPDNEWWYVWSYDGTLIIGPGDSVFGSISLSATVSQNQIVQTLAVQPVAAVAPVTGNVNYPVACQPRRWFGPGTQFGVGYARLDVPLIPGGLAVGVLELTRLPA